MRLTIMIILFLSFLSSFSQTEIELELYNGVYLIPCKVNDIPMKFVLDTGASNVSISSTEALFLIKQGKINEDDFIGKVNFKTASGEVLEGTQIILRKIDINGIIITDITATIVHKLNSPLLLGQSALSKLGDYSIKGNKLIIENNYKNNYEKEMEDAYDWINKAISSQKIEKDSLKINHFFSELYEASMTGYILVGHKKKTVKNEKIEEVFFIKLNEVTEVYIEQNTEISNVDNLVFEVNEKGDGIILKRSNSDSMFKNYAYVIELHHLNELFKERLIKAIEHLLLNNISHSKNTQKF